MKGELRAFSLEGRPCACCVPQGEGPFPLLVLCGWGMEAKLPRLSQELPPALLFFAQGTPMLVSGDEFGQSREGNNNPYCQDNAISWLNWDLTEKNGDFLDFVRAAVRLRREHPVLHLPGEMTMLDYIACGYPDLSYHGREAWRLSVERTSREAGLMYCGSYARIGKKREDLPWIETEFDEEFRQWILDFPNDQLPRIYELLEQYRDGKEIHIFRSREEAEEWLGAVDSMCELR